MKTRWTALLPLCLAASAVAQNELASQVYATGFTWPLCMVEDPTNPNVHFVLEQRGRIRPVVNGVVQATDFLNLAGTVHPTHGEGGLLGMAFHPNYAVNRFVYVSYTDTSGDTRIVRYTRNAANPLLADPGTASKVFFYDQPFSNHNGGTIYFGPNDGYLYVGLGDGGSGNDPGNRAQTITNMLLGKMLRLDVNGPDAYPGDPENNYAIPATNPFFGETGDDEIWSFGLRNPWKWSFDNPTLLGTGGILIGDVGQNAIEELNYEPPMQSGRNYGWREFEGNNVTGNGGGVGPPYTFPIHTYTHAVGFSVTGGYVYRGLLLGDYFGRYFFADHSTRRIWSFQLVINPATGEGSAADVREHTSDIALTANGLASINVDSQGEIYFVNHQGSGGGSIIRLLPQDRAWATSIAPDLQTPLLGQVRSLSAADGKLLVASQLEDPNFSRSFQSAFFVNMATNMAAPSFFDVFFDVQASSSIGSSQLEVFMRNWSTNQLDSIGSFAVNDVMATKQIIGVAAANYRRAADGAVQLRFHARNEGAFDTDRLTMRFDRVKLVPRASGRPAGPFRGGTGIIGGH